jgi:Double-stranded RNA binding motif
MSDSEFLKTFAEQHEQYEITYSYQEAGPGHAQTFKYTYKMGDRVIGDGDALTTKATAKASAASKARLTLRGEGYNVWLVFTRKIILHLF